VAYEAIGRIQQGRFPPQRIDQQPGGTVSGVSKLRGRNTQRRRNNSIEKLVRADATKGGNSTGTQPHPQQINRTAELDHVSGAHRADQVRRSATGTSNSLEVKKKIGTTIGQYSMPYVNGMASDAPQARHPGRQIARWEVFRVGRERRHPASIPAPFD